MASTSTASSTQGIHESGSRRSMEYTEKSNFAWPFHKAENPIQSPLRKRNSLPAAASKLRMVGRGGSGSKLRRLALSNTAVLEHASRQPPEPESSSFYRPTGRGGGSLNPPVAILDLLRRRKRGPSASIPQNIDSDHNEVTDSYLGEICPTCHEHRQRSLNKLTRTLGALPSHPAMESRQLSELPFTLNNSSEIGVLTNLGAQRVGLDSRSSFESDSHSESTMTFSPPSPTAVKNTHPEQIPTTTRREKEKNSAQSHSSEESPASSTPHIYVSNHSTLHFDTLDLDIDLFPEPTRSSPNAQCDWLVPPETQGHNVISITRTAPSKPQSWTGEWNNDINDVIESLRRL